MRSDPNLVHSCHRELHRGFSIRANLTRFGGLAVFVYHPAHEGGTEPMWQGKNILEARAFADEFITNHTEGAR